MNIIIESLDSIRITGSNTDIDSAKLFIHKEINQLNSINIALCSTKTNAKYLLAKELNKGLEKTHYFGYRLLAAEQIPSEDYLIELQTSDTTILTETRITISNSPVLLSDEHSPILIIGKEIMPITTVITAEDHNSQQLSFYMRQQYDGVSFIDSSKKIMFDFIPVDAADLINAVKPGQQAPSFLSTRAQVVTDSVIPPVGYNGQWVLLHWNLPYLATKKAGIVKFAISVIDEASEGEQYVWQTLPSQFTVGENLGPRNIVVVEEYISPFLQLVERVTDIESFLGNNTDDDASNDKELIIGGGSAADYFTEEE